MKCGKPPVLLGLHHVFSSTFGVVLSYQYRKRCGWLSIVILIFLVLRQQCRIFHHIKQLIQPHQNMLRSESVCNQYLHPRQRSAVRHVCTCRTPPNKDGRFAHVAVDAVAFPVKLRQSRARLEALSACLFWGRSPFEYCQMTYKWHQKLERESNLGPINIYNYKYIYIYYIYK